MAKKIRGKNEGSIYRMASGKWRAITPPLGNGKRLSHVWKTKEDCQQWLREQLHQLDQGFDVVGSEVTLERYIHEWLETNCTSLRPKTFHQYESIVRKHIVPYIGTIRLKDLNLMRVEHFYGELRQAGSGIRTIQLTHSVLHRALERAVRFNLILRNPAHNATVPRQPHTEMQVLDESQVLRFLLAARGNRYEAFFHLAIVTGMRQAELFGLKWPDLHWESGVLEVHRQVQWVPGQSWSLIEPKTKAGRRTIKLWENMLQALRKHQERQQVEKELAGERWQDHDFIFPSTVGTPSNPSNMRIHFNKILADAGVPKVRFHDLRHTAASLMLNHRLPVIVVAKVLGHSKPSVTYDIYAHLYNEMQDEAARVMDDLTTLTPVEMPARKEEKAER